MTDTTQDRTNVYTEQANTYTGPFGVRIVEALPPPWESIVATFQIRPKNAIFAYGDRIYNPDGIPLADYLVRHEMVHFAQQDHTQAGAALWWGKFLRDPEFRIEQEVEAYGEQLRYMRSKTNDRNQPFKILHALASSLSGPLYDHCISHAEAMQRIKLSADSHIRRII